MNPDILFQVANTTVLLGWAALLASPWMPTIADRVAGLALPALLSVVYSGLILAFWSRAGGGFETLSNVAALFETRELLLAGWLHYLAFDLFVGAWIVREARERAMPFLLVLPCLPLTFLFGPAGLVAFLLLREVHRRAAAARLA